MRELKGGSVDIKCLHGLAVAVVIGCSEESLPQLTPADGLLAEDVEFLHRHPELLVLA